MFVTKEIQSRISLETITLECERLQELSDLSFQDSIKALSNESSQKSWENYKYYEARIHVMIDLYQLIKINVEVKA